MSGIFKSTTLGGLGADGDSPFPPEHQPSFVYDDALCRDICTTKCGPQPSVEGGSAGAGYAVWSVCNKTCLDSCNSDAGKKEWIDQYAKDQKELQEKRIAAASTCLQMKQKYESTSFWDDPFGVIGNAIGSTLCDGLMGEMALTAQPVESGDGGGGGGDEAAVGPDGETISVGPTPGAAIQGGAPAPSQGMSGTTKVAILAAVGVGAYLLLRRK